MLKSPLSTRPVIEALEARIAPATFTVTTTSDSGPGSLRQAIIAANALEGADTINFVIPGDQLQIIALTSPLPAITEQVTLSALSAYKVRSELVRIDGTAAGAGATGLTVAASGSLIAGLEIANFSGSGLLIDGGSSNVVLGNSIFGNGEHGIHIKGGGSNRVFANVIGASADLPGSSGNKGDGILLDHSTVNLISPPGVTDSITVQMPYYGLPDGNTITSNGLFGIEVRNSDFAAIAKNDIKGNGTQAASLEQGGGIAIFDSKHVSVGTVLTERGFPGELVYVMKTLAGNLVSENTGHGILIRGQQTFGTTIAGNTIKSNLSGDGVRIDGAVNTQFGLSFVDAYTTSPGPDRTASGEKMVGNTITQNAGWGIAAMNGASTITIKGSTFSENVQGAVLLDHVSGVEVGGLKTYTFGSARFASTTSDANTIGFGAVAGIVVKESSGVQVTSNTFSGSGIPIDLGGDGSTANDPGDLDTGANHLLNSPSLVLTSNQLVASLATDAANTKFRIQLYKFDPSTGYSLLSTQEVTTGVSGQATSTANSVPLTSGQKLFATATNLATGETSELSSAAILLPQVSISSGSLTEGNSGSQNLSFTVSLDSATTVPVKVAYHSTNNTATAGEDYAAIEGLLVFEPGETTKTITVPVFGDTIQETSEQFYIDLTNPENAVGANLRGTGTIVNDDALPTISIQGAPTVLYEGSAGSSTRQFTVTLSNPSLEPVTVRLRTVADTASSVADFSAIDEVITFAPGTTSVTKTVSVSDDILREGKESFTLQLSQPGGGVLGNASSSVSIVDDDTWVLEPDFLQVVEGNDGYNVAVMKVRLWSMGGATDHEHAVSVDFSTQNGTATAGSDFVTTQGTLTFLPGEFEKTITIPLIADTLPEQNENFRVIFSNRLGASLARDFQDISILNDDPGTFSVAPASITEGHSGQKLMVFNVTLSAPSSTTVSANFSTQGGSAFEGVDFEPVSGQLSFAPGETQKTISVPIYGDRTVEQHETLTLKLTDSSGATLATATGTILNDDPLISIESAQFLEGQPATPGTRSVYLPVRLSQATDIPVTVDFATSDGTAEAASDYIATSGTITFAPGQTLQFIELQIVGDLTFEPDETFSVKLSNAHGAPLDTDTGLVTIKADEPFITAQNVFIAEGHSGTKELVFTVSLSQAQNSAVTLDYATADGTATAGSDYTAVSGTLTFAPGEITKTVSVPIHGDTLQEADEILKLHFSNVSGASLATTEVHGTITNDDSSEPLPVLSVANVSGVEGNEGNGGGGQSIPGIPVGPFLPFTFTLSKASSSPVSVHYGTADGTATAGSDYTAASGTLTFAPGETTKTILVPILADSVQEANETLNLLLSEVSGATLAQNEATGTILNDDVSLDSANFVISNGGRKATWTDSDGDQITLKATKPVLALSSFHFVSAAEGDGLVLQELDVTGQGSGASGALGLSFSVKKSATGDGLLHVGAIDAAGRDLSTLSLPGRLGWISAGDANLKTPGIGKLTVDSFGLDSATAQAGAGPMMSEVKGSIGSFTVKHDFTGANLTVSGGSVGSLVIGGSLEGTSAATPAGISIEKNLSTLRVGGDVNHANVIAGSGTQAGAHVGQVLVGGDWTASNLVVGAGAGPDGLYGTGDDEALQDTASRIAKITIRGAVDGTAVAESGSDHFGFVAGRIAAFQVGGQKLALTSKWQDSIEIGTTSDVLLRELAGRSRS